jgi:hypothetical protein
LAGRAPDDDVWHNFGGHRVWLAPETADTYAPDNAPCQVSVTTRGLTAVAPVSPRTGLQKRLTLAVREDGRLAVENGVRNTGSALYTGAVWALTCVEPTGVIVFPWGSGGSWDLKKIVYWNRWMSNRSDVLSAQWRPGRDLFQVVPSGEQGKVGANSPEGWIAQCREDATFVKTYEWSPTGRYPDEDCSLQVYTCSQFVELETLGPLTTIYPGREIVHREVWTATAQAISPDDGAALRRLAGLAGRECSQMSVPISVDPW